MAPTKNAKPIIPILTKKAVTTRSRTVLGTIQPKDVRPKRKAECSPTKDTTTKRSALSDLTNAITKKTLDDKSKIAFKATTNANKKPLIPPRILPSVKTVVKPRQNENLAPPPAPGHKITTRATLKNITIVPNQTAQKPKENIRENAGAARIKTRLSNEFEKTEESLYSSALEESNDSIYSSAKGPKKERSDSIEEKPSNVSIVAIEIQNKLNLGNHDVPNGVDDFDKENWDDIFQASHYAMDIFNYLKEKETVNAIPDYMERQTCLTKFMRALLVDWMVEIQESFELNHETLYLGVKLVDLYLSKKSVNKETLQLVGAAAMFVASKYDERIPPMIDDFLYICDGAYNRNELIKMEVSLLKTCDFDLGIPISYRFLRRYARCSKTNMQVLTLARFILEYSLMDYATVTMKDSVLAAAALYLALKMKNVSGWTPTLEFYTGYKLCDILDVAVHLNQELCKKPRAQLMTVHNKYSHKVFYEVAKTPLINDDKMLKS